MEGVLTLTDMFERIVLASNEGQKLVETSTPTRVSNHTGGLRCD